MHFQSSITILVGFLALNAAAAAINPSSPTSNLDRRQQAADGTSCANGQGDCQSGKCISRGALDNGQAFVFNTECADQKKLTQQATQKQQQAKAASTTNGKSCANGGGFCQGGKCISTGAGDSGQPFVFNTEC